MKKELTEEQKRAHELRKQQFASLVNTFADFSDEEREKLAATMGGVVNTEGHKYSLRNTWMVKTQKLSASIVGTFGQWIKMGRVVNKGEKAAMIAVPVGKKDEDGKTKDVRWFTAASVFDISQTIEIEKKGEKAA